MSSNPFEKLHIKRDEEEEDDGQGEFQQVKSKDKNVPFGIEQKKKKQRPKEKVEEEGDEGFEEVPSKFKKKNPENNDEEEIKGDEHKKRKGINYNTAEERDYRTKDKPRRGRQFDKHSGTGRGKEIAKGGAGGKGTWGENPKTIARNFENNNDDYYFENALNPEKKKERQPKRPKREDKKEEKKEGEEREENEKKEENENKEEENKPKVDRPEGRSGQTMNKVGNVLYIFGGKLGVIKESNELWTFDPAATQYHLVHDILIEQYSEEELKPILSGEKNKKPFHWLTKREVETRTNPTPFALKNQKKKNKEKKNEDNTEKKHNKSFTEQKSKYSEQVLVRPNVKMMKASLVYTSIPDDLKNGLKKLEENEKAMIDKESVLIIGSVPEPRDGQSTVTFGGNKLIIFGGDRNKFPFNDLFIFDTKTEAGEPGEDENDKEPEVNEEKKEGEENKENEEKKEENNENNNNA